MKFKELKNKIDVHQTSLIKTDDVSERTKNLESILKISTRINQSFNLDEILELVLQNAIKLTKADRGFIVLKNEGGKLDFKLGMDSNGSKLSATVFEKSGSAGNSIFKISTTVVEEVFFTNQSKFIESAQSDLKNDMSKSMLYLELQSILCSPLVAGSKKIGVIYVDSKSINKIKTKNITDTFEILANQASIAINNAQLYDSHQKAFLDLQKANVELEKAKDEAEKSNKLKSEFLAQMSHEIRTPLNTVINYTNLVREEFAANSNELIKECFNSINNAGKRLIRTVELLLNMSELSVGSFDYNPININIAETIISPLMDEYKIVASKKDLNLSLHNKSDHPVAFVDEYSTFQIFSNIIDNALKFTQRGSVEIFIYHNDTGRLMVDVCDTGIGISKEYMNNLFNPFSQEKHGYSREFDGNGLGLALAKNFANLNKVDIVVSSEKGKGSTFTVVFNAKKP